MNKQAMKSSLNLLELTRQKVNLDYFIVCTQDEFNNVVHSKLESTNDFFLIISFASVFDNTYNNVKEIEKIKFSFGHGVDEEAIILNRKHNNSRTELLLNASLYSCDYKSIIHKMYNLEPNKKTIVIFETTSLWIFKRNSPNEIILEKYQTEFLDLLVDLKKKYNIIIRSHPQDYNSTHCSGVSMYAPKVKQNFMTDYMPIPIFNFYEIADFIISSRFSASGYQSLFVKNKNYIILEHDFDVRQLYNPKDIFLHSHTNIKIENLKNNNIIANNQTTPILYENDITQLYNILSELEKDDTIYENSKDIFAKQKFNIDRMTINDIINTNILETYVNNRIFKNEFKSLH